MLLITNNATDRFVWMFDTDTSCAVAQLLHIWLCRFSVIGRRCTLYALFGSIYFKSAKVQITVDLLSIRGLGYVFIFNVIVAADCRV